MIFWQLFVSFFASGLFAIGGGLATIPFVYDMADRYTWLDHAALIDIIAVAQSAPGPFGVNVATYVGWQAAGFWGSAVAAVSLIMPSFLVILIVSLFFNRLKSSSLFETVSSMVHPAALGMIAAASWGIIKIALFTMENHGETKSFLDFINWKAVVLFIALVYLTRKFKKHPVFYIALAAAAGILFSF